MRRRWSAEEIALVRENIAERGAKWCAEQLGVRVNAIYMLRRAYDLPYSRRGISKLNYTLEEIALLRETPTSYGCVLWLAQELGRTRGAIKAQRHLLKNPELAELAERRARNAVEGAALPRRWRRDMDALLHGLRAPLPRYE